MSITCTNRFAQIECKFDNFGSHTFWDTWQWKLDTFRIYDNVEKIYDLTISNGYGAYMLEKTKLIYEIQTGFFKRQIFRLSDGGTQWRDIRCKNNEIQISYNVNADWNQITLLEDNTNSAGHIAFEYLGQIFTCCALPHNVLSFHGVLMEHEKQGIIISAPSGTGKTTHARLWREQKDVLIINGDRAACKKVNGAWTGFGLPWSGTSGEQINRSVPIKALVVLERGEVNEAGRITAMEAFGAVLPHVQCPTWDAALTNKAMELLDDFLSEIPVVLLRCHPDVESVEVLSRVLEEL